MAYTEKLWLNGKTRALLRMRAYLKVTEKADAIIKSFSDMKMTITYQNYDGGF